MQCYNPAGKMRLQNRDLWLVLIACLLLLAQELPLFQARWVEDENWYGSVGYTLAHEGHIRNPMFPDTDPDSHVDMRPPMTALISAAVFKFLGVGIAMARLPFLLLATLTVILCFFVGAELESPLAGAIAALLLATDNIFFIAGRTVRPESPVVFASCLAVLLYLLSQRRRSAMLALAAGVALGMALDTHPNGLAALASIGIFSLIEFRHRILIERRFWAMALGVMIGVGPFLWWAFSDPLHRDAFLFMYTHGQGPTVAEIPGIEKIRYADFLGLSNQRVGIFGRIPVRLHIVVAIFSALVVLYVQNRRLFWRLFILIAPCPLLWAFERHPTTRYFVICSPWFAILFATAMLQFAQAHFPWRKLAYAAVLLVGVSQLAGNAMLLYSFRNADYLSVERRLRALIPPGEGVYGAITFWLALHDHPFSSWNRTPIHYAVAERHVSYLILNDRVLVHGSGFFGDDWYAVRTAANDFARNHATLIGEVDNPFYGDLLVYRVNADALAQTPSPPVP